jgi:hypothetical protein
VTTVYISVGNSDGGLSEREWASYWHLADKAVRGGAQVVHGVWHSMPASGFVNACWCVEFPGPGVRAEQAVRRELARLAGRFRQDSVAWAECASTEFITPEAPA